MKQDIEIQPAEHSDLEAIFELFSEIQNLHRNELPGIFKEPRNDAQLQEFFGELIENESEFLELLMSGQKVIGYVHFSFYDRGETIFTYPRKSVFIHQLVISTQYRRKGLATLLLEHVKQEAQRLKAQQIDIDYWSFNTKAKACFQKAGFAGNREFMRMEL